MTVAISSEISLQNKEVWRVFSYDTNAETLMGECWSTMCVYAWACVCVCCVCMFMCV